MPSSPQGKRMVWLISFPEGTTMDQSAFRFTEYDHQTETQKYIAGTVLWLHRLLVWRQICRHIVERAHKMPQVFH